MAIQSGSMQAQDTFTMDRFNELRADVLSVPGSPSDVTASRAFDTSYQNISGAAMLVCAGISFSNVGVAYDVRCEINNDNFVLGTVLVSKGSLPTLATGDSAYYSPTFSVPNSYYYRIRSVAGNAAIQNWAEYTI